MPRICKSCSLEKDEKDFYIKDKKTGRLDSSCKTCFCLKSKEYVDANKLKTSEYKKKHYEANKSKYLDAGKVNRKLKKKEYNETKRTWELNNRDKVRSYRRKMKKDRKSVDILFKIKENLRCRYSIVNSKKEFKKSGKFSEYLGCSLNDLRTHLQSQFKDSMNWDNYGIKGWHIDHIIPLDSAKTEQEVLNLLHYTNLQPLWASENYSKGSKCLE